MANIDLKEKMVVVPPHDWVKRETIWYLYDVWHGELCLIDFDGDRMRIADNLELREATKEEVVVDFLKQNGLTHDINELPAYKKQELIDGMFPKVVDMCRQESSKYFLA